MCFRYIIYEGILELDITNIKKERESHFQSRYTDCPTFLFLYSYDSYETTGSPGLGGGAFTDNLTLVANRI